MAYLRLMNQKRTLILGATTKPAKYAFTAASMLTEKGHEIVPVGVRKGEVMGQQIITHRDIQPEIDTITLYINPQRQVEWYDYILQTAPKRIIFNPGTENPELANLAQDRGIEVRYACTLVMLTLGDY